MMATKTDKTPVAPVKQYEQHLMIDPAWNSRVAIPASLASQLMPHLITIRREYKGGQYVLSFAPLDDCTVRIISPEQMEAAAITTKLLQESKDA